MTNNLPPVESLRSRVAEWSQANFGEQASKFNSANLGHLAPLLGINEELGELAEADRKECEDGRKDAIADIVIYMCDFAARLEIDFVDYHQENISADSLVSEIGVLNHHVLKMHQGIRGYEDITFALTEIRETVYAIFDCLHEKCNIYGFEHPFTLATNTFNEIVSKRDWKKNPEQGNPEEDTTPN